MQDYTERVGVKLAPHAKTTMCPQLFARQLDHGCWGLVSRDHDPVQVVLRLGCCAPDPRQPTGRPGRNHRPGPFVGATPQHAYYVLIDSFAAAKAISDAFGQIPGAPPARVLIEMGMAHGRCGVRTLDEGLILARAIQSLPRVELHGVEGYEGLIVSDHADQDTTAVSGYLSSVLRLYELLVAEGLFTDPDQIIVSAGGSAYYDLVAQVLAGGAKGVLPILRSGCYLTHDSGFYRRLLRRIEDRAVAGPAPRLTPALEVWSRVISRPQSDQAIVLLGKRDVSYDIDLPAARWWFREVGTTRLDH